MKYVAYYRKSPGGNKSKKQLHDSLSIDAQHAIVVSYLKDVEPIAEFTDIESGKKHMNRPELLKAIAMCQKVNATLVIAKLDRLSRDLHFVTTLQKEKIKFVCCDNPHANDLNIQIMAAFAEDERKRISQRTKDALAALKKRGVKLGNPANLTDAARKAGIAAIQQKAKENPNNKQAILVIGLLKAKGGTLAEMAAQLNSAGMKTAKGKEWKPETVRRLIL